jgi:bifunctional DNase/RNase
LEPHRVLDIQVGHFEAFAIASGLEGQQWERPMTHDLLGHVMAALGATLRQVLITDHRHDVYFAEMELIDRGGSPVTVSARPSDAIALALRLNAPILVSNTLLADAA